MIGVFVTFQYDDDFDRAGREGGGRVEVDVRRDGRPAFEGVHLRRNGRARHQLRRVGLRRSRAQLFSPDLSELVTGLYGVAPTIGYVEIAELVDNTGS